MVDIVDEEIPLCTCKDWDGKLGDHVTCPLHKNVPLAECEGCWER